MRLNKFLATAGVASRRQADELITQGQVTVNGQVVQQLGVQIDPAKDAVTVADKKVILKQGVTTYLLNKPKGVVTTAHDPQGRKTVLDFLPKTPRVFPCGRLDENTQGLVVLTNDGNLCYQLTHPKFEHEKEYIVHGSATDPQAAIKKLAKGVQLKDGPAKPDRLGKPTIHHEKIEFTITIHEGRNRIVRRMCAAVGIEITTLTRTRVGKYQLGDLLPGEFREV